MHPIGIRRAGGLSRRAAELGVLAAATLIATMAAFTVRAACPPRSAHLTAGDGLANDGFGVSVAVDGDVIVVGANGRDDLGASSGAAYVYRWDGLSWRQEAKLAPSDPEATGGFGWAVAVSGDTIFIGARRSDGTANYRTGAAYVFRFSAGAWRQEARLEASDGLPSNEFGFSVALDGDTAIVGAPGYDWVDDNVALGAAYVFTRAGTTWTEQAKLMAAAAHLNDRFGSAVAVEADRAVVGARLHDAVAMNAGAVFVFDRLGGTWTESAMLLGSDTLTYEGLGVAVALSGDSIAAGCPGEDTSGNGAGAVRVFVRGASAWTEQAKITPSDMDGGVDDTLGNSVALQADTLVVGSWQDDDASFNAGAAYVFRRVGGTWSQSDKHLPAVATGHDWLGFSVALSGNTAVAGISRADDRGSDAGAADVFDACQAIAVLRNGTMTARSRAQLGAVIRPGQSPALDPVRDLHAADVSDLTEIAIGRDAAAVGEGAPGVVTLYELMGSSRVLRVAKQSGDVVLTGW